MPNTKFQLEEIREESRFYQEKARDARDGLRLVIAHRDQIPASEVTDEAISSYIERAKELRVNWNV